MNAFVQGIESDATPESAYATMLDPTTLALSRRLPGPVERVWAYLTDSKLRRQWLAAGELRWEVGSPVEFVWRNDELSSSSIQRPAGFPEEQRMEGSVTEIIPSRKLAIAWDGFGEVSYELEREGGDVLLTMIQRHLPAREVIVMFASGSHAHLDILAACLTGAERPSFWDQWTRLQTEYESRIPA